TWLSSRSPEAKATISMTTTRGSMPGTGRRTPTRWRNRWRSAARRCSLSVAELTTIAPLTDGDLLRAVDILADGDPDLAGIVGRYGPPPMWAREPGFGTLVHIVLEQQVSLASAQAAFDRLRAAADPLTPDRFLELSDAELLAIGFSRQKARYGRALAVAIETGALDLDALETLGD